MRTAAALTIAAGLGLLAACASPARADEGDEPVEIPGKIHKILEMDDLPALKHPRFVAAAEAEIPDDHRMIGVVIGDEARAYCPNILNHHEIVNDDVGGRKIAVTW